MRLQDGVRPLPFPFLWSADGNDDAEHAAPGRLALLRPASL
ncbi:hypothetical protein [Janthinobacterium sp. LB3P112]